MLWWTLQGLAAAGHELQLIAPLDAREPAPTDDDAAALAQVCTAVLWPVRTRSWSRSIASAFRHGGSVTTTRHFHPSLAQVVADRIASWRPDVVHAEQLQAMRHCAAATAAAVPRVLRMQNVESSLWRQVAQARLLAAPLAFEAGRVRRDECEAVRQADRVLSLSADDTATFAASVDASQQSKLVTLAPAFPSVLPAAPALEGDPAIVLAGSGGWWPNAQAMDWFLDHVCPLLWSALPGARVHVFGGQPTPVRGVVWHPSPADATAAFPEGAIAAVPLQIGSGIRMRILDAWARGLPVVASPVAAAGLAVASGRELLIAQRAEDFVAAIVRLHAEPALRANLRASGRAYLRTRHDIAVQSERLIDLYAQAGARLR